MRSWESSLRPAVSLRSAGSGATAFTPFATKGLGWLAQPKLAKRAKAGGARRDRTADLLHAMQALSQLSYGPVTCSGTSRFPGRPGLRADLRALGDSGE